MAFREVTVVRSERRSDAGRSGLTPDRQLNSSSVVPAARRGRLAPEPQLWGQADLRRQNAPSPK